MSPIFKIVVFSSNHDYVSKFPSQLMINYNQQDDGRLKLSIG